MISIRDALGDKWKEIRLYDDNSVSYGGISHSEETLEEFIAEVEIDIHNVSIGELQKRLKNCGIKEIEAGDRYVEEILQQKIWDIENELGITICDYRWDYE